MKKNTLLFLYISLVMILPHCAIITKKKKQGTLKIYKQKVPGKRRKIIKAREYKAYIEGVECPFCAQTVIDLVKQINGIVEASYQKGIQGYEDGVLLFSWDIKKDCDPRSFVEEALKKEDFEVRLVECVHQE